VINILDRQIQRGGNNIDAVASHRVLNFSGAGRAFTGRLAFWETINLVAA